ncbi:MAG: hypothetical protein WBD81_16905 [Collimonas pratensis]
MIFTQRCISILFQSPPARGQLRPVAAAPPIPAQAALTLPPTP